VLRHSGTQALRHEGPATRAMRAMAAALRPQGQCQAIILLPRKSGLCTPAPNGPGAVKNAAFSASPP